MDGWEECGRLYCYINGNRDKLFVASFGTGVELKVSPYRIGANGKKSAKERLILTMIDYCNVDYPIHYAKLFTPPSQDIKIISHDYELIIDKIKEGKAHELSEGDTLYLGAATKASSSAERRAQPYGNESAKPRAFSFKTSYMTYVLNDYIVSGKANIVVKAIRVEKNNRIVQSMSFPNFKFKEIVQEEWENTEQVLLEGLKVEVINGKNYNNFPGLADSPVSHVRPHGKNAVSVELFTL